MGASRNDICYHLTVFLTKALLCLQVQLLLSELVRALRRPRAPVVVVVILVAAAEGEEESVQADEKGEDEQD